jgi:hypothetical protein
MEEIVVTKRGTFGFIRVTIPMVVKQTMLDWCSRSGMRKAEFFRVALMMGSVLLADQVKAKKPEDGYLDN